MTPAIPISTKISKSQLDELDAFIEQFYPGMDRSKYIRYLIEQDMQAKGVDWPEYEFVDNAERHRSGLRWKSGRPRKTEG